MNFSGKRIILGVCGSIAAYKAPLLAREIIKYGGEVRVVMTRAATKFVAPLTLQNLTKAPIIIEMFDSSIQSGGSWHIHLARECDAMIIAPTSAATLSRIATGLCDTALITTALSLPQSAPLLLAPAMDSEMWLHPATQRNAAQVQSDGAIVISPSDGDLASGFSGIGRLPDIDVLLAALSEALNLPKYQYKTPETFISDDSENRFAETSTRPLQETIENDKLNAELAFVEIKREYSAAQAERAHKTKNTTIEADFLKGKKIIITAGPTYEKIDDVRFIGNFSSGKMGFALAEVASNAGANVTLIAGPVQLSTPQGVRRIDVTSAAEMYAAVSYQFSQYDCAVFAAAVADFTPVNPTIGKIKKESISNEFDLRLEQTRDILAEMGKCKAAHQIIAGFALESENEINNGRKKLAAKNADLIIINSVNKHGSVFQSDENTITIISQSKPDRPLPRMSKKECAMEILRSIAELL